MNDKTDTVILPPNEDWKWNLEQRLNAHTTTYVSGYPERGPYPNEDTAYTSGLLPPWAIIVKVYEDERGWWAVFTCTTMTLPPVEGEK